MQMTSQDIDAIQQHVNGMLETMKATAQLPEEQSGPLLAGVEHYLNTLNTANHQIAEHISNALIPRADALLQMPSEQLTGLITSLLAGGAVMPQAQPMGAYSAQPVMHEQHPAPDATQSAPMQHPMPETTNEWADPQTSYAQTQQTAPQEQQAYEQTQEQPYGQPADGQTADAQGAAPQQWGYEKHSELMTYAPPLADGTAPPTTESQQMSAEQGAPTGF